MKKFLSLVLALVMTMSLVTIGAGAKDFTDDSKITYEEAVDVISAVGVVDGYTDGSFNPTNQLTRGAAAKIICNLILGPTTASALSADAAPFSDVPTTNEFAGYIAYCSQQGIINGYNDSTFRPAAPLTGYAFLKMLLGALGYDGEVEGFTGPNWSIQVGKLALGIGLTKGNDDFVGTQYVNREEACLYSFNTLKADMVQYDAKTSVSVGGAEVVIAGSKAEKILQSTSGYDNTLNDGGNGTDAVLQFAEKYFPKLTRTGDRTDAFGRPANEWKYKSEIVGTYTDYSDLLETYTAKAKQGDLYDLVGASIVKKLDADNVGEYNLTVYVDGAEVADPAVANYFTKNSSNAAGVSGNGILTEVFMDDDNNVVITFVRTYLVKATADYNSTKEELSIETVEVDETNDPTPNLPTTISNDDLPVADFKEDDYILVTVSLKDGTPSIESVEAAEVVVGKVSEYTETDYVIIDGTKYSYNKLVGSDESKVAYTIGEDASVVMDSYGYILYVDEAVSTSSYVYIQEADQAVGVGSKIAANAFFTDGTNDAIILKKVAGNTDTTSLQNAGGWYTFIKDSADKYSLAKVIAPQSAKNGASVNDPSASFSGDKKVITGGTTVVTNSKVDFLNDGSIKANANTVFILWNAKNETYVYEGIANAPTVKTGTSTANGDTNTILVNYIQKNGYATYVFIDTSRDADAVIDDVNNVADYLFILKSTRNKTVVGEDTYYQYKVLFDGEETTKYIEQSIVGSDAQGVMVYNVKANDKDYITSATLFEDHEQSGVKDIHEVTEMQIADKDQLTQSGKTISIQGDLPGTSTNRNREYIVDNDTKITLVMASGCKLLKDEGASYELYQNLSASALAGLVKGYDLDATVFAVTDDADSDVLDYLYVYVENANEIVAPSNKTTVNSLYMKGVEAETTDGIHYTVEVGSKTLADGSIQNFTINCGDGASVQAAYASTNTSNWGSAWGNWNASEVASSWAPSYQFKFTIVAADGTTTKDIYVTPTYVTTYSLTFDNQDDDCAVQVTYNNKSYVVGADENKVLDINLKTGDTIQVSYVKEDNGTIGAVSVSGAANDSSFNGVISIEVGSGDITIQVANA